MKNVCDAQFPAGLRPVQRESDVAGCVVDLNGPESWIAYHALLRHSPHLYVTSCFPPRHAFGKLLHLFFRKTIRMHKHPLVGSWQLVRSDIQTASGQRFFPLGEQCDGVLILTDEGLISAHLMRTARPLFAKNDMRDGTPDEIRAAYEGYVALWGIYTIDSAQQQLTYRVQGSLFPNWIGQDNLRYYQLQADLLTLRTPPFPFAGELSVAELVWKRRAHS